MPLATSLGTGRLLARAGDRRLHLLDARAAVLWDLLASGLAPTELAELVSTRFGLSAADARQQIDGLVADWHGARLLQAGAPPSALRLDQPSDPCWPPPSPTAVPVGALSLVAADRRIGIGCDDPCLKDRLDHLLCATRGPARIPNPLPNPIPTPVPTSPPKQVATQPSAYSDHRLHLHGTPSAWRLTLDALPIARGSGADAALVAIFSTVTELGCRPAERLLVVHGAGLVAPDGRGLLLVAPGGAGKSTLAAALDAAGLGLLSDDVVPVTRDGTLLPLGLPLCLKPGSWPVLAKRRPELSAAMTVQRFGQPVRYLPAATPAAPDAIAPALLLCPRYQPDAPPGWTTLQPEQALQQVIEAEAVLRALDQSKLDALARWISQLPAYALHYPDLDAGVRLVNERLRSVAAARTAASP